MSNLFDKWKWVCVQWFSEDKRLLELERAYDDVELKAIVNRMINNIALGDQIEVTSPVDASDPEAENAKRPTKFTNITWSPVLGVGDANVVHFDCDHTGAPIIDNVLDIKHYENVGDGLALIVKQILNYYIDEMSLHSIRLARLKVEQLLDYTERNINAYRDMYIYYRRDGEVTILQSRLK